MNGIPARFFFHDRGISRHLASCTCPTCVAFEEQRHRYMAVAVVRDEKPTIVPIEPAWRPSDGGES